MTTIKKDAPAAKDATHSKKIVEDTGGNRGNWDELAYDTAAEQAYVDQFFVGHEGPVAVGLLRMWESAVESQRLSKEYRDTFDSVNADIFGPDTPKVFG